MISILLGGFHTQANLNFSRTIACSSTPRRGGVSTSVLINIGKVLLMSSDFIKSGFFVYTHTQLLAKMARSGMVHSGPSIAFSPIFICYPHPRTHVDPKHKKDKNKIN